MVNYRTIHCDSLIRKITRKDTLFEGFYCLDPYQNCEFQCTYCDSSFDTTIYIKTNAAEILTKELGSLPKQRVIIGSVHDPYQQAEKNHSITKSILQVLQDYDFPCHILTKSPLILQDLDLLSKLDCYVSLSILSLHDKITSVFEPYVSSPKDRLETVQKLTSQGIHAGIALIPILPYMIDDELNILVKTVKDYDAQYLVHTYLELRGDQKQAFQEKLKVFFPKLVDRYNTLYATTFQPDNTYIKTMDAFIHSLCIKNNISERVAPQ